MISRHVSNISEEPPAAGFLFQMVGMSLGFATTLLGKMRVPITDCWVERKAVKDYSNFLQGVDFDEKSIALIRKNIEDEKNHIKNWEEAIQILKNQK